MPCEAAPQKSAPVVRRAFHLAVRTEGNISTHNYTRERVHFTTHYAGGHMNRILYALVLLCAAPALLLAQVPTTMSYQGYLTDNAGTPVADGTYNLTFALYTVASGGVSLWTESHPSVSISKGLFNVTLGRGNPTNPLTVPFDQEYYLGVRVGVDPEMTPRVRLTASAYSFRARVAEGLAPGASVPLGGDVTGPYSANTIAANAVTTAKIADNAVTAAKIAPDVISSLDGVHNDGGNIDLIAGANIIITPDDGGNSITIAATGGGGGLTLPYDGTTANASPAFDVENTGTGRAAYFHLNNAGASSDAVWIQTVSTNASSDGIHAEAAAGNAIEAFNNSASQPTLYVYNNSTGPVATFGNSSTSTGDIVSITKSGGSGKGMNIVYGGTGSALAIDNNSTGTALDLRQDGTGMAAYFHIENTTTSQNAVTAESKSTSSNSDAFQAKAVGGRAFYGTSASGSGTSTVFSQNTNATGGGAYYGASAGTYPTLLLRNMNAGSNNHIIEAAKSATTVFTVDTEGDLDATGRIQGDYLLTTTNLGSGTPAAGGLYRDNVLCAWARVSASGSIVSSFGISSVTKTSTGTYQVNFSNAFASGNDVCATASARQSATNRFVMIGLYSASYVTVEIYSNAGVLVDNDFSVIVTGRQN